MNSRETLHHGNLFPFDATDEWWNDSDCRPPLPPTDWVQAAARGVIAELQGRRGIKHELERSNIDEDTRVEIVRAIAAVIVEAFDTYYE